MSAVPATPSSDAGLRVIPVWRQVTPSLVDELTRFWLDHQAIGNAEKAAVRAQQAVLVARDADGSLCGVATAMLRVLPRLRQPLYYYRQFFAPRWRGRYQALTFFRRAKQVLQAYNAGLPRAESLGLLLEIENPQLAQRFKRAHMPQTDATFIGYSPAGLQLRVSYFDGAELLPPAPPGRAAPAP
jgi:hypothetical protein